MADDVRTLVEIGRMVSALGLLRPKQLRALLIEDFKAVSETCRRRGYAGVAGHRVATRAGCRGGRAG